MWSKFLKIAAGGGIEAEIKPKFIDFLLLGSYCTVGANLSFFRRLKRSRTNFNLVQ